MRARIKINEIITDKYKLRMPPTVYYDLLADVLEAEEEQEPKTEWIPLKTRPMTEEESTYYRDCAEYGAEMFDCPLPDDGQEVLISCGGYVCTDVFARDDDDGCYFEEVDIDDVEEWMPLPKPYGRIDNNDALFVASKKPYKPMGKTGIEAVIRKIGERCLDRPVFCHLLRHTCATTLVQHGMPIEQVQYILGHSSLDTTMIYAKTSKEQTKYNFNMSFV